MAPALCPEKCGREQTHRGQVNYPQSRMPTVNAFARRTNLLRVRKTPMILKTRLISNHCEPFAVKASCLFFRPARAECLPTDMRIYISGASHLTINIPEKN